jgi:hypothetical protein
MAAALEHESDDKCRSLSFSLTTLRLVKLLVSKHALTESTSVGETTIRGVGLAKNTFQFDGSAMD